MLLWGLVLHVRVTWGRVAKRAWRGHRMTAGHTTPQPTAAEQSVRRHVVIASGTTALGGRLFGYDTRVVSGALLFLKDVNRISPGERPAQQAGSMAE